MKNAVRRLAGISVLLLAFHTLAFSSWAIDYPTKPITLVYCYAPGGGGHTLARGVAASLERILGQPVVVVTKPGATGTVGMGFVASSKPDGYTLVKTPGSFTVTPHFQPVPYDITKDFTYLIALGNFGEGFFVRGDSPFKTLGDLVEYARKNPNQVKIGCQGLASSQSLTIEYVAQKAGVRWTIIPFKGAAENIAALLGGHIHAGINVGGQTAHVKAGTLRMLAVNLPKRLSSLPDVPTLIDSGYNFTTLTLFGVLGPKGIPEPVVQKLTEALVKVRKDPAYLEVLKNIDLQPAEEIGKDFEKRVMTMYKNMAEYAKLEKKDQK